LASDLASECGGAEASDLHDRLPGAYRDHAAYERWQEFDIDNVTQGYFDVQGSCMEPSVNGVRTKAY